MRQNFWAGSTIPSGFYPAGTALYSSLNNTYVGFDWFDDVFLGKSIFQTPGNLSNLILKLSTAPGIGASWTFTIVKNGVDTNISVTISGASTSGSDTSHSITVAKGDWVAIKAVDSGSPTFPNVLSSIDFNGTNSKESVWFGVGYDLTSTTRYSCLQSCNPFAGAKNDETLARQVVSTNGVLKNLYVELSASPAVGESLTFRVYKNGSSTGLTVTISNPNTSASDDIHTVSISAGDEIDIQSSSGAFSDIASARFSSVFVADIDGESVVMGRSGSNPSNSATNFIAPNGGLASIWDATETNVLVLSGSCTLKKFYVATNSAPTAGKNFVFTIRKNSANPSNGLVATVANAATTANDITHEISVSNGDTIDIQSIPSGTPTTSQYRWGIVMFISPFTPQIIIS